jgi:GDP/UDP-N,N'-diacetylbacillosamine 2-epimerase (hydrolysing)
LLTSSRADYGIYLPLLKAMREDPFFDLHVLAFGTHLSEQHGQTVSEIREYGFQVEQAIDTVPDGDTPAHIAAAMGKTMSAFSTVWEKSKYPLIIALGDRYEMFAAVASSVPFGIPVAHIHGGETTLGAIDNAFRNSITHMSTLHFVSTDEYAQRVAALTGSAENVYTVGALSIDNLKSLPLLSIESFKAQFGIDLAKPTILITFHPETVAFERNAAFVDELIAALENIQGYQLVITMPNADTMGNMIRQKLNAFIERTPYAKGVESFGALGYLSCMKHCTMMLGNTSSGFVEAAFFPKYVINLGSRQSGRIISANIRNCTIDRHAIQDAVKEYAAAGLPAVIDIYGEGNAAANICSILKKTFSD